MINICIENCVIIGKSKKPLYNSYPNLSRYLIVPLENIVGLEDARYMPISQISSNLTKLGDSVVVNLK